MCSSVLPDETSGEVPIMGNANKKNLETAGGRCNTVVSSTKNREPDHVLYQRQARVTVEAFSSRRLINPDNHPKRS